MAYIAASITNPLICLLQKKWKAPRSVLSVLMVVLSLLFVMVLLGGFVYALGREIIGLAQNIDVIVDYFNHAIAHLYWISAYIPANAEEVLSGLVDGFSVWVQSQGAAIADSMITNTVQFTTRVGGGVVSVVIFILASYFMMADYHGFSQKLKSALSRKTYKSLSIIKSAALGALGGYLKAQIIMATIVFVFSLVALLIIQQEFALLLAFILGLIDLVPLIGTAAMLVPWAIVSIIGGDIFRGVYLLAMSLILFLMRRVLEPKVVGSQMGLSPLTALTSIYIGMQLGGVIGLILGPIVAMVIVSLYKAGLFDGWVEDVKAVMNLRKGQ